MKMDIATSQSWWSESHSRPKHSKWLQENLADVEANIGTMLSLIEGDADSFAQRAEMYYKKRPDLLKVVEQFYRGYRALAERYDQLNGSVHQVPSALQAQYGLTIDSPRSSPFGKLNRKQFNSVMKESLDESKQEAGDVSGGEGEGASLDASSMDDKGLEHCTSSSSSDVEYEGASLEVQRLQKTVEHLQAEYKTLMDRSREKQQQYRETEKRLHAFREDFLRTQKENNTLKAEVADGEKEMKKLEAALHQLHLENESLQHEVSSSRARVDDLQQRVGDLELHVQAASSREAQLQDQVSEGDEKRKELAAALRLMNAAAVSMFAKNKALVEQISGLVDDQKAKEQLICDRDAEVRRLENMNQALEELRNQVSRLELENEEQRITVDRCGEEKREVIRQLCYTIDLMNDRNHWLERTLLAVKSKLVELQKSKTLGCGIFA